jgi:N-acetylmuramoyl-L-alanine amidase
MKRRDFICSLSALALNYASGFSQELNNKKPRVLLDPGHNTGYVGCERRGVGIEYVLNTRIAEKTKQLLDEANDLEVIMSRDENNYLPGIMDYREKNKADFTKEVEEFRQKKHIRSTSPNTLPLDEAVTQLAIAGWAEDNGFDAVVHVHVNDVHPSLRKKTGGFTVITSNNNGSTRKSRILAGYVYRSLREQGLKPSNLPVESTQFSLGIGAPFRISGFMIDDYLIIGSEMHQPKTPTLIVECGYIYQNHNQKQTIANKEIQELYAGALNDGVRNYFYNLENFINSYFIKLRL